MLRNPFIYIVILLIAGYSFSQDNKTVFIKNADSLIGSVINGEQIRELIGNVEIIQGNLTLKCNKARQYFLSNKIEVSGNVIITQDTLKLYANDGEYFSNDRLAVCKEGIKISDGHVNLAARKGSYNANLRLAFFENNVKVEDSLNTIFSDYLTYDRNKSRILCTGNVRLSSKDNKTKIFGDSLENYQKLNYTKVYPQPELLQIDTAYLRSEISGKADSIVIDTMFLKSKILEWKKDFSRTYLYASDSVRVYRKDLALRCGKIQFNSVDSIFLLRQKPVIWYIENQIYADSTDMFLEKASLKKIHAMGSAFALSQYDTSRKNRYNQISGQILKIYFNKNKLDTILSENQSMALYYVLDEDKPNGVNKSSGDKIIMLFSDGKIKQVKVNSGVEGTYYPEKMLINREGEYNLPRFKIFEDRPKREEYRKSNIF